MATITVRNLPDDTKSKLQARAARKGSSLEEEVRSILNTSVNYKPKGGAGTAIHNLFKDIGGGEVLPRSRVSMRPPPDFSEW